MPPRDDYKLPRIIANWNSHSEGAPVIRITSDNASRIAPPHETISASAAMSATITMKTTASKSDMRHMARTTPQAGFHAITEPHGTTLSHFMRS